MICYIALSYYGLYCRIEGMDVGRFGLRDRVKQTVYSLQQKNNVMLVALVELVLLVAAYLCH